MVICSLLGLTSYDKSSDVSQYLVIIIVIYGNTNLHNIETGCKLVNWDIIASNMHLTTGN